MQFYNGLHNAFPSVMMHSIFYILENGNKLRERKKGRILTNGRLGRWTYPPSGDGPGTGQTLGLAQGASELQLDDGEDPACREWG